MQNLLEVNKVHNMDCLDGLRQLDDNSIDMVLTSPPYDNLRDYKGYKFDFKNTARELKRVIKDGGVIVWIVGDQSEDGCETLTSFKQALFFKRIGLKVHDTMIYRKNCMSFPSNNRYQQIFEYMFILCKGKLNTFNPLKRPTKYTTKELKLTDKARDRLPNGDMKYRNFKRQESTIKDNIWDYDTGYMKTTPDEIAYDHPAIFPDKLAQDHILSWSNPGDLILDPFMGSGTTAKMCMTLDRNYLGFEISPEYCRIANKRLFSESKTLDMFIGKEKVKA
jgi:site-specific DNA-methyltransferase (adenine-specific)